MSKKRLKYAIVGTIIISITIICCMNLKKFGRSVRGERLARVERSVNYRDGRFHNQEATPQLTSDKSRLSTMYDFLFEKRERNRPDGPIPTIMTDIKSLRPDDDLVIWFGHSSYLIQNSGKRLLIDPVFEEAAPFAFLNRPFEGTDIYKAADMPPIDYLIITHDHWDHLDYKTVTVLRDRVSKVICPLGVGEHLQYWGYSESQIVEMDWNENSRFDDGFIIHCLPSRHFSGRTLKSNQTLWASYMIVSPTQQTIFLSGDGGYGAHFRKIAEQFPIIDIAIIENGQYNENWRYIHLMPQDLREVISDIQPRKIFAGHNGKYALSKHAWDEPLDNAASLASDTVNIITPIIGEVVYSSDTTTTRGVNRWWKITI